MSKRLVALIAIVGLVLALPAAPVETAAASFEICGPSDDPIEDAQCNAEQMTRCLRQILEHGACQL